MKRTRLPRHTRQTPDFEQLVRLASGLGHSCCRAEDAFWEARLATQIDRLLEDGDESTLTAALDHLYAGKDRAYDALAEMIEARCETRTHTAPAKSAEAADTKVARASTLLRFNAPILAWSRYAIPATPITAQTLANLRVHLQAHIFAEGVRIGLADYLYSPDQLPQSYCATAELTDKLGKCALHSRDLHLEPGQMPETASFLSDMRYILGVVAVAPGAALFRWQEDDASTNHRDECLSQWRKQGDEVLRPLLTGCVSELLLPQSYHAACRDADRQSRPYSLRASVAYLGTTLNIGAGELRAVIAPFYEQNLEEYRIGFTQKNSSQVIHGVVWPMLDAEDDAADMAAQIETVLREIGVGEVLHLDHRLPLEYCDDCGAPLYPNPEGEPVHAEMPEEQAEATPRHLH